MDVLHKYGLELKKPIYENPLSGRPDLENFIPEGR